MDLNKIKQELITKTSFKGSKLNHSIRFIKMLHDGANGITNLKELPTAYLNKFFKSSSTRNIVINKLLDTGFIERTDGYIVGAKSKSYRLVNQYLPDHKKSNLSIMKINVDGSIDEDIFSNAKPEHILIYLKIV